VDRSQNAATPAMDIDASLEQAQVATDLDILTPRGASSLVGSTNMEEQHQRGFAVLQALVQRGGLEEFERVLRLRDDAGDGFLTLHDMRSVLDVPTHFAAGDVDYRRYRIRTVPRLAYQVTKTELDDLASLPGRDPTGRLINYAELVELGASLMEVEGLKQLLSEGFVQILPQTKSRDEAEAADEDGGYSRNVLERNRLRAAAAAAAGANADGSGGRSPLEREAKRDGSGTPTAATIATAAGGGALVSGGLDPVPSRMPLWWLCWQQFFWFTQFLTFNLLLNILLPFRVIELLGGAASETAASEKAYYLALMNTVANFVSLTSVFWGAASDATRTRWGRRRPYVIVGQALACGGLFLMSIAPSMWMLTGAFAIYVLANNIACAVYQIVVAELVPPDQRGTAGGFFMVFQTTGNLASSVVGYLVGDAYLTSPQAYGLLIALNALDFLVGVSGLGQRPGLLNAEAPPPPDNDDGMGGAGQVQGSPQQQKQKQKRAAAGDGKDGGGGGGGDGGGEGAKLSLLQKVCGFLSAFRSRSFTSLFFFMFTLACFITITNQFLGYWVQDMLGAPVASAAGAAGHHHGLPVAGPGSSYALFGWHLTNSAQSATSILIAITSCAQAPSNLLGGKQRRPGRVSLSLSHSLTLAFATFCRPSRSMDVFPPSIPPPLLSLHVCMRVRVSVSLSLSLCVCVQVCSLTGLASVLFSSSELSSRFGARSSRRTLDHSRSQS
jgi:MFS family permease